MMQLLFICSRNQVRSLTAERLFDGSTDYRARSAGTQPQARIRVTAGLIGWADLIFVMERSHLRRLEERFADALEGKQVACLNIPDDFVYGQSELVAELESRLTPYLPGWTAVAPK